MADDARISARSHKRSVDRALTVLRLLARRHGFGRGEVARAFEIPGSSATDVRRALLARDFVVQNHEGHDRRGLGAFEVGAAYLRSMSPIGMSSIVRRETKGQASMEAVTAAGAACATARLGSIRPLGGALEPSCVLAQATDKSLRREVLR
jgi:hypothetical protein